MGRRFEVIDYHNESGDTLCQNLDLEHMTKHFKRERRERYERICRDVGFGHAVRSCLVDTGHRSGLEVHTLTTTGVVLVFNAESGRLVTMLVARPGQMVRYYAPFNERVPRGLYRKAYQNACVHHWNKD